MKTEIIICKAQGKEIARKDYNFPETVDEIIENYESDIIVKRFNSAEKLEHLRVMRAPLEKARRAELIEKSEKLKKMIALIKSLGIPQDKVVAAMEAEKWSLPEMTIILEECYPAEAE